MKLACGMICDHCGKPLHYTDVIKISVSKASDDTKYVGVDSHTTKSSKLGDLCKPCFDEYQTLTNEFFVYKHKNRTLMLDFVEMLKEFQSSHNDVPIITCHHGSLLHTPDDKVSLGESISLIQESNHIISVDTENNTTDKHFTIIKSRRRKK